MSFIVKKATGPVALDGDFENDPQWKNANTISIANRMYPKYNFFKRLLRKWNGTEEREMRDPYCPVTDLKVLYDDHFIYALFRVRDQYVRAVANKYGDQACTDSCVEFFIKPGNTDRYYNFELTAGGFMLLYNVKDLRGGDFLPVSEEEIKTIQIYHSLPPIVDPEIREMVFFDANGKLQRGPLTWYASFAVPIELFAKLGDNFNANLSGQTWTANAYKCSDTSHPHWLTWLPIPKLDFHLPAYFGDITFE